MLVIRERLFFCKDTLCVVSGVVFAERGARARSAGKRGVCSDALTLEASPADSVQRKGRRGGGCRESGRGSLPRWWSLRSGPPSVRCRLGWPCPGGRQRGSRGRSRGNVLPIPGRKKNNSQCCLFIPEPLSRAKTRCLYLKPVLRHNYPCEARWGFVQGNFCFYRAAGKALRLKCRCTQTRARRLGVLGWHLRSRPWVPPVHLGCLDGRRASEPLSPLGYKWFSGCQGGTSLPDDQ